MLGKMSVTGDGLSIGSVAEATGISVHALRFFEREGIFLRPIPRSGGGHRVYEPADVEWLLLCNRLRESGMPIATIRRFAELVRAGAGNERDRLALLEGHERLIKAEIDRLRSCLEVIHGKVAVYAQHVRSGTTDGLWAPEPTREIEPVAGPS
jgi:DNA-binding transcriptional MerR regulator